MFEASATPLIAATFVLLLILFIWWLVVEWGFKEPASNTDQFEHRNDQQAVADRLNRNQLDPDQLNHKQVDQSQIDQPHIDQSPIDRAPIEKARFDRTHLEQNNSKPPKLPNDSSHSTVSNPHIATASSGAATKATNNTSGNRSPNTNPSKTAASKITADNSTVGGSKSSASQNTAKSTVEDPIEAPEQHTNSNAEPNKVPAARKETVAQASAETTAVKSNSTNAASSAQSSETSSQLKTKSAISDVTSKTSSTATDKPAEGKSKRHGADNKKTPSAQPPKYQTAAKTQSPSVRSEASIQIQTDRIQADQHKPDQYKTDKARAEIKAAPTSTSIPKNKNITNLAAKSTAIENTISIASNRKEQSPKLKNAPKAPVALHPAINTTKAKPTATGSGTNSSNSNYRKQSHVERAMARQISEQQHTPSKDAASNIQENPSNVVANTEQLVSAESQIEDKAEDKATGAEQINHGDTALRAQLASSERRIQNLQSTLNNLQQNQSQEASVTTVPTASLVANPHTRPTLMSKVRILDTPRS